MTLDDLSALEKRVLDMAKAELQEDGGLSGKAIVVGADGGWQVIVAIGDVMNLPKQKGDFFRMVKAKAREANAAAVVFVSDSFYGVSTPEQHKAAEEFEQRLGVRLNVEQRHALGFCTKVEAILVTVQTPILQRIAVQQYIRHAAERRIELTEYRVQDSVNGDVIHGRAIDFFDRSVASVQ